MDERGAAEISRVGPKGYIHGWVFVGAPGVGAHVVHPHLGRGTVTEASGSHVKVRFESGGHHAFPVRPGSGPGHFDKPPRKPLAAYAHPDSVQHDAAFQDAVHAEDYDAAVAALKALDKTEAKAGVKPGEGTREKIAGSIRQMESIKRDKRRQYKELGGYRDRQAGEIAATASQVITATSAYTKTTPEQAARVKTSLASAAERVRAGDYEGALKDLTAAREAAQGPGGTSVMTSGREGRGAVYRIDDHIKDVQRLADEARDLAKYAPAPKAARHDAAAHTTGHRLFVQRTQEMRRRAGMR